MKVRNRCGLRSAFAASAMWMVGLGCGHQVAPSDVARDASAAGDASAVDAAAADAADTTMFVCADDAPRLIAPLSTSSVPTSRPMLRLGSARSSATMRVEVCRDRACLAPVWETTTTADSVQVSVPLRPGMYYWHALHVRCGSGEWIASPTWQIEWPGAMDLMDWHDRPITPSPLPWMRYRVDFDADGLADLAVGTPSRSTIGVYFGGPRRTAAGPDRVLRDETEPAFGASMACAGDVDGDGFSDLVVALPTLRRLRTYLGGVERLLLPRPGRDLEVEFDSAEAPRVASIDDVDGDGFGDVVVAQPALQRATVFFGSSDGLRDSMEVPAPAGSRRFGSHVSGGGEHNADGVSDFAVGDDGGHRVFVYRGTRGVRRPPTPVAMETGQNMLSDLAWIRDADGDGGTELVIATVGLPWDRLHIRNSSALVQPVVEVVTYVGSCRALFVAAAGAPTLNPDPEFYQYRRSTIATLRTGGCVGGNLYHALMSVLPTFSEGVWTFREEATGNDLEVNGVAVLGSPGDFDGDGASDRFTALAARGEIYANFVHRLERWSDPLPTPTLFTTGPSGLGAAIAR